MKTGSTRLAYADALIELGRRNKNLVVLDADLAHSTQTLRFKEVFPDRFFNMGIAEADMVNTAAGLATCGKIVFCSSFAIFVTGKAWEQIRNTLVYSNLNVKIVATHSGVSVGPDGASHHCLEDLSLMRSIPEVTVIAPADPAETKQAVLAVADRPGVAYIRITRQDVPICYGDACPSFEIGRANTLVDGADVALIATGTMVHYALQAAQRLRERSIQARVLDMHTIKPLDRDAVLRAARETKGIVTAEEHSIIGGLGSAVAETVGEEHPTRVKRIGVRDRFGESGSFQELFEHFGLTAASIEAAALEIVG